MNVCLWSQIDQALAVYVSEWADQTKDMMWGKMGILKRAEIKSSIYLRDGSCKM